MKVRRNSRSEALSDDLERLRLRVLELEALNRELQLRNLALEQKLLELSERRAARREGKSLDEQKLLDFVQEFAEEAQQELREADQGVRSLASSTASESKSERAAKRPGRGRPTSDIPRVRQEFSIPEADRICECNRPMPEIGEVTSEELARVTIIYVHQTSRKKYACNRCDSGVLVANGPKRVLPKSMAGPSMLAWALTAKFGDHLPYYRMERILAREGASVTRATLCNWMTGCSDLLVPVHEAILRKILAGGYVQTDDTSKRIQRGRSDGGDFGHIWVSTSPAGEVAYHFTETRSRHGPLEVLKDFEGYVQADACSAFDELFRRPRVNEVGCWAHAKRKFDDAKDTDPDKAGHALEAIGNLYRVEREAARKKASVAERHELRAAVARPVLDAFRKWLDIESLRVLPRSPIAQAMGYVLNQWEALIRYLEDGRLEIDNNRAERMIKPVAIGRKNDLFVYSAETAKKAMVNMTVVESAKALGIDPFTYLNDILQDLAEDPKRDVADLLPAAWKARRNETELRREERKRAAEAVARAYLASR